jgi:hypothetical protein
MSNLRYEWDARGCAALGPHGAFTGETFGVKPEVVFGATHSNGSHEIFKMNKLGSVYENTNDPARRIH